MTCRRSTGAETGGGFSGVDEVFETMLDRRVDGLLVGLLGAHLVDLSTTPVPVVVVNGATTATTATSGSWITLAMGQPRGNSRGASAGHPFFRDPRFFGCLGRDPSEEAGISAEAVTPSASDQVLLEEVLSGR